MDSFLNTEDTYYEIAWVGTGNIMGGHFIKNRIALAGWLCWLEHRSIHPKVVGSIPGQGTYLGCGV